MRVSQYLSLVRLKYKNTVYIIINSPQRFSGIIYNTVWRTLLDC